VRIFRSAVFLNSGVEAGRWFDIVQRRQYAISVGSP
jgi:hypothetical protein